MRKHAGHIYYLLTLLVVMIVGATFIYVTCTYSIVEAMTIQSMQIKILKVGLIEEETGVFAPAGRASLNAARLAAGKINSTGGVLIEGRRFYINLIDKDNQSSPEVTKSVTNELINVDNVGFIMGPNVSSLAKVAADIAEQNQVILISPWSTDPEVTKTAEGDFKKYIFRAAFLDSFQGEALAKFAYTKLNAKKAAVLYDGQSDLLKNQANFFILTFYALNGEVTPAQTFNGDDADFTRQLNALKEANPDVIFLPARPKDAAAIIKQAKTLGITAPFLGSDAWEGFETLKLCHNECENYYISAHFSPNSTDNNIRKFVSSFEVVYGTKPNDAAALSYDAVFLLRNGIAGANSADPDKIAAVIRSLNFRGVTGFMNFLNSPDPAKDAVILRIKNNNLEE